MLRLDGITVNQMVAFTNAAIEAILPAYVRDFDQAPEIGYVADLQLFRLVSLAEKKVAVARVFRRKKPYKVLSREAVGL